MAGFARVTLIGNLGADPEVRFSAGGVAVAKLSVACTEKVKGHGGDWEDRTEWVRLVCFGKTAENAGQYLEKGRQVYADGRLQTSEWKDKDGNRRWTTEVICNELLFLGGGDKSAPPQKTQQQKKSTSSSAAEEPVLRDEDIPF